MTRMHPGAELPPCGCRRGHSAPVLIPRWFCVKLSWDPRGGLFVVFASIRAALYPWAIERFCDMAASTFWLVSELRHPPYGHARNSTSGFPTIGAPRVAV